MPRQILLDEHDEALAELIRAMIDQAVARAHRPSGFAKRIAVKAMAKRNRGRKPAMTRYPFQGICEVSGLVIDKKDADHQFTVRRHVCCGLAEVSEGVGEGHVRLAVVRTPPTARRRGV